MFTHIENKITNKGYEHCLFITINALKALHFMHDCAYIKIGF